MCMRAILIALAALGPLAAAAQEIFSWVDEDGSVHYTDDPENVPQKKKGKVRTTTGADIGQVPSRRDPEAAEAPATERPAPEATAKADRPAEPAREADADREKTWRAKFHDLHERISKLEAQIASDRREVERIEGEQPGETSESPEHVRLKNQIRDELIDLDRARHDLEDLEHEASQQAVPREWRR